MMKHYRVQFTVIHNAGVSVGTALSRSVKRAFSQASSKAWDAFERSGATNWADEWVTIYSPSGKVVASDWASNFNR